MALNGHVPLSRSVLPRSTYHLPRTNTAMLYGLRLYMTSRLYKHLQRPALPLRRYRTGNTSRSSAGCESLLAPHTSSLTRRHAVCHRCGTGRTISTVPPSAAATSFEFFPFLAPGKSGGGFGMGGKKKSTFLPILCNNFPLLLHIRPCNCFCVTSTASKVEKRKERLQIFPLLYPLIGNYRSH